MNEKDKELKQIDEAKPTSVRDMMILVPVILIWIGMIIYSNFYW
jgi:hypothetical protein